MPICSSCGGNFDNILQLCPYCGMSKPEPHNHDVNLKVSVAGGVNACPGCQSNNKVEKVTTIFKSQIGKTQSQMPVESTRTNRQGEGNSSADYQNYSVSHFSNLAQELAPPQKPTGNSYGCCIAYFIFQMIGMGILGLVMIPGGLMFLTSGLFNDYSSLPANQVFMARLLGAGIPLVFIVGYIGIWFLFFLGFIHFRKKKIKDQKRVDETEGVAWQKAMNKWDNLYYCYRCDCIFIPGEQSAPSKEMRAHIYKIK